jgi:hypothetical protein
MWWVTTQKNGASALGLQRVLGLKSYETAWTWLHKLRRAMVRPRRDLLAGRVEVDECYVGGLEEGLPGRLNIEKALVVVAAQEDGPGDRQNSHAPDCGCFRPKPGALCAGLGGTRERHPHRRVARLPAFGEEKLRACDHISARQEKNSVGINAASPSGDLPPQTVAVEPVPPSKEYI